MVDGRFHSTLSSRLKTVYHKVGIIHTYDFLQKILFYTLSFSFSSNYSSILKMNLFKEYLVNYIRVLLLSRYFFLIPFILIVLLQNILSHSSVVFINTDPLVDFARPTLSNIIPIGGITVSPPNPLNQVSDHPSIFHFPSLFSIGMMFSLFVLTLFSFHSVR